MSESFDEVEDMGNFVSCSNDWWNALRDSCFLVDIGRTRRAVLGFWCSLVDENRLMGVHHGECNLPFLVARVREDPFVLECILAIGGEIHKFPLDDEDCFGKVRSFFVPVARGLGGRVFESERERLVRNLKGERLQGGERGRDLGAILRKREK